MVQEAERVVGGALKTPVETTENGVGASEALDMRIKAAHKLHVALQLTPSVTYFLSCQKASWRIIPAI